MEADTYEDDNIFVVAPVADSSTATNALIAAYVDYDPAYTACARSHEEMTVTGGQEWEGEQERELGKERFGVRCSPG